MKAIKYFLNNYANFKGRARRREFWIYMLVYFILGFGGYITSTSIPYIKWGSASFLLLIMLYVLSEIIIKGLFIPTMAVAVRRIHDVGKSGWYTLIPVYNIILFMQKGNDGDNEYGAVGN